MEVNNILCIYQVFINCMQNWRSFICSPIPFLSFLKQRQNYFTQKTQIVSQFIIAARKKKLSLGPTIPTKNTQDIRILFSVLQKPEVYFIHSHKIKILKKYCLRLFSKENLIHLFQPIAAAPNDSETKRFLPSLLVRCFTPNMTSTSHSLTHCLQIQFKFKMLNISCTQKKYYMNAPLEFT